MKRFITSLFLLFLVLISIRESLAAETQGAQQGLPAELRQIILCNYPHIQAGKQPNPFEFAAFKQRLALTCKDQLELDGSEYAHELLDQLQGIHYANGSFDWNGSSFRFMFSAKAQDAVRESMHLEPFDFPGDGLLTTGRSCVIHDLLQAHKAKRIGNTCFTQLSLKYLDAARQSLTRIATARQQSLENLITKASLQGSGPEHGTYLNKGENFFCDTDNCTPEKRWYSRLLQHYVDLNKPAPLSWIMKNKFPLIFDATSAQ